MSNKLKAALAAFAGPDNDITFPALMGFYRQTDPTLNNRHANIHLYHQIFDDPHASSVLRKRASAINAYRWDIVPRGKNLRDKKAAEGIKAQFDNLRLAQIREEMLLAELVYGFGVGEAMWRMDGGQVVLDDILARDQIRFNMSKDWKILLKTLKNMVPGEAVPDRKFIWSTFDRRNNGPYGRGLGSVLWWPCYFKRILKEYWLEYADKFTTQAVVGTYPEGATADMQAAVLAAAEGLATGSKAVAIPFGTKMEGFESKRAAAEAVFARFIEYLDEEMSKAVLGEAMTTGPGAHASKATSEVHTDLKKELAISDASRIDTALNQTVIKWLTEFNYPGAQPPRLTTDTTDPVDFKKEAEIVAVLFSSGWKRTKEWMENKFGGEFEDMQLQAPASEQIRVQEDAAPPGKGSPVAAGSSQVNINAAAES